MINGDFDKSLSPQNYELLSKTLKEVSGLLLTDNKMYLVETRLLSVASKHGCKSLNQLIDGLKGPQFQKLKVEIAEAMATPETFFFRDKKPFEQLKDYIIPNLVKRNAATKHITIWCAACSSGQEPYSVAMIIDELKHTVLKGWNVKILATDFSEKILGKARDGIYSQFEVQRGLPIQHLMKYFTQTDKGWRVKDTLKSMIDFRNFNLLLKPSHLGVFDVIFCRNVLFYFDKNDKNKILGNIADVMNSNSVLFLGAAESTIGSNKLLVSVDEHKGIYAKMSNALANAG